MTYDKTLGVNEVERIIRLDASKEQRPIELVTFSACQTAEGDDRAPLGFSGLAIKANAQNALGALWDVPDIAAKQFMRDYYSSLKATNGDAGAALQQAQQAMLKQPFPLSHPAAWAAFILVGAW
jgi:CHAT domain-containing protein